MRSRTAFSRIVAGLLPLGAREAEEPRSSRKRRSSAAWWVLLDIVREAMGLGGMGW